MKQELLYSLQRCVRVCVCEKGKEGVGLPDIETSGQGGSMPKQQQGKR